MTFTDKFYMDLFSLAHHWRNTAFAVVEDRLAHRLVGESRYRNTQKNIGRSAMEHLPGRFENRQAGAKWAISQVIAPLPLAYATFMERSFSTAVYTGAQQRVFLWAGFSTLPYRQEDKSRRVNIFEINNMDVAMAKHNLLTRADIATPENVNYLYADVFRPCWDDLLVKAEGYRCDIPTFVRLGDLPLYMTQESFKHTLDSLFEIIPPGSSVVFCYGDKNFYTDSQCKTTEFIKTAEKDLLSGACYSYMDMERLLYRAGFLIYEHLTPRQMHNRYFFGREILNRTAFRMCEHVNCCLAVKKEKRI